MKNTIQEKDLTMNLEEAKMFYLNDLAQTHYARVTIYARNIYLNYFIQFLNKQGVWSIEEITKDHILAYLLHVKNRKKSAAYVMNVYLVLKMFFKRHHACGHIQNDLSGVIVIPKRQNNVSQRVMSESEVKRFLALPNIKTSRGKRDRAILELIYSSGLRTQELINLDLYDLSEQEKTLRIRQAKGKKDRVVPIGRVALAWLKTYLKDVRKNFALPKERALFVSLQGGGLQSKSLSMIVNEYRKKSGNPKRITPHSFRHTCATHLLKNGAGIRYVQEILGHTSAHSTEIYTHLDIKDLKEAARNALKRNEALPVNPEPKRLYHYKKNPKNKS